MALTKVLTGGIADSAITTAKITDANITTAKVADDAVTSAKIPANAVTNSELNLGSDYAFTGTVTGTVAGTDAFSARGNADSWIAASINDIVQFHDDSTGDSFDTGSRYSTSTYKYTARADGVYLFYYVMYTANNDTNNGFGFLKNSTKVAMQYNATNNFTFDQGDDDLIQNASIILPLSANDTMAVMASIASDYYRGHSHWGGCRLA